MKVLVLNGSPRGKKGNTEKLVAEFTKGLTEENNQLHVEEIYLKNHSIKNCIGCFSCWKQTPGQCILKDEGMHLLDKYIEADLIIWATPLYHYGMTSIMKTFVERTLPLVQPYIIKKQDVFSHPPREGLKEKKNILIANCGFPEKYNFDILVKQFEKITDNRLNERILCVQGELLSVPPLRDQIQWYLDAVRKAGKEFSLVGAFHEETKQLLKEPLVPIESFIEMANTSWNVKGENPPNLDYALGRTDENIVNENYKDLKGYSFMKLMGMNFNEQKAENMNAVLAFHFTDIKEDYYFLIKNKECKLYVGESSKFTTKIRTNFKIWEKISMGELDGAQAMMDGLYKIEGDFDFMLSMNGLFSREKSPSIEEEKNEGKILGIDGEKWMNLSFIPWMGAWIFIESRPLLGLGVPLLMSLFILLIKEKNKELTFFEKGNVLCFGILNMIYMLKPQWIAEGGKELTYFIIGIEWLISVTIKTPLTSDYSKFRVKPSIQKNKIFIRTNVIMTLFWSFIFFIQGTIVIILKRMSMESYLPFMYILLVVALIFTKWFPNWYPKFIATEGKTKTVV
ncbi:MAG: NAD(P)H-dependent oxidoreductase [Marinisporobacter sp.]|jgi:multimeric flavodoxin WrbA/putative sterol carrier protein|nr:NAD(P)H-dependent oxidoreductase [Marinisporobacter sp.]